MTEPNRVEPENRPGLTDQPFSRAELRGAWLRPDRLVTLVLTERERLAATLESGRTLGLLAALLLWASLICVLPCGLAIDPAEAWRLPLVFLGSLLICFPSLHIFGAFLGYRVSLTHDLASSLIISCVTALFALAFAPIIAFMLATMRTGSDVNPGSVTIVLLTIALLAGMSQAYGCSRRSTEHRSGATVADGNVDPTCVHPYRQEAQLRPGPTRSRPSPWLMLVWQGLLLYMTYRMAVTLGVL